MPHWSARQRHLHTCRACLLGREFWSLEPNDPFKGSSVKQNFTVLSRYKSQQEKKWVYVGCRSLNSLLPWMRISKELKRNFVRAQRLHPYSTISLIRLTAINCYTFSIYSAKSTHGILLKCIKTNLLISVGPEFHLEWVRQQFGGVL